MAVQQQLVEQLLPAVAATFPATFAAVPAAAAAAAVAATRAPGAILDSNKGAAGTLWFSDEAAASAAFGNISAWDVTRLTNTIDMFEFADSFNADLSGWDLSSVCSTHGMFTNAKVFNSDLNSWAHECVLCVQGYPGYVCTLESSVTLQYS